VRNLRMRRNFAFALGDCLPRTPHGWVVRACSVLGSLILISSAQTAQPEATGPGGFGSIDELLLHHEAPSSSYGVYSISKEGGKRIREFQPCLELRVGVERSLPSANVVWKTYPGSALDNRTVTNTYDDAGNRITRSSGGATDSYQYDFENRLVGLTKNNADSHRGQHRPVAGRSRDDSACGARPICRKATVDVETA